MNELEVRVVDPFDDEAIATWVRVATAVAEHEVGDSATMWAAEEMRVALQTPRRHRRELLLLGLLDDETVAAGLVELPLMDNLASAELELGVLPDVRRRGVGSRMLARLEAVCAEHGRTRLDAMVPWLYDGPSDGTGVPGVAFARSHGYSLGLLDVQRELPLPVDTGLLDRLAEEAAPFHADYEVRSWEGRVPDELAEGWQRLASTLMTEAPMGEREVEPETDDVEALRSAEHLLEKQGRRKWNTVAVDRDGPVVGYSELILPTHAPRMVLQWGTSVHPEHRGHRLGMAMKAANLRRLQADAPDALAGRRVITWNAEVNDHMVGINEQLGFRPAVRVAELQKKPG